MSDTQQSFAKLRAYLNDEIIGQERLIERMLITLLGGGHLIVQGAPGLAKTKAIKKLASAIECDSHRIQFTPDLLPADITGSDIYRPETGMFVFQKGPIFHNLILADEINRAPAKVQSALLEGMAERQVTVGATTYMLPELFMVMAAQNPIEHEGTYALPEAQLDRFLMFVTIGHPDIESERKILRLVRSEARMGERPILEKITQKQVRQAKDEVQAVHLSPELEEYIVQFIMATRDPSAYSEKLKNFVEYGASPRGTLALLRMTKASAFLSGRDYAMPEDVAKVFTRTCAHRIRLSAKARTEEKDEEAVLQMLLSQVKIPGAI